MEIFPKESLVDKLANFAEENGYYWSLGSHPELKFDARVWMRSKDTFGHGKCPTHIGIGDSLSEAVDMCLNKGKLA